MNKIKRIYSNFVLNREVKKLGYIRRKSVFKVERLETIADVEEYFKQHWRVRNIDVKYIKFPEEPGVVNIHIKSWLLLNKKKLSDIKTIKPFGTIIKIYNKSLFSERVLEF